MDTCTATDHNVASVIRNSTINDQMVAVGHYEVACYDADGHLKWSDTAPNVVPNQGKNSMLDTYFVGSGYSAAWYMSLITAGTATSTSTCTAPTITETTNAVIAGRISMTWMTASNGSKSSAAVAFAILGPATITGNMVVMGGSGVATVGNTSAVGGVLFSAANFAGGSKPVSNGDTLNVTYSIAV